MTPYDHEKIARYICNALTEYNRCGTAGLLSTKQDIERMLIEMGRAKLLTRAMVYRHLAYLDDIYKRKIEKLTKGNKS